LKSLVFNFSNKEDVIIPRSHYEKISIEGAIVLEPHKGHYKDPIIVYDFKSLYPSCIISYNISPDTYIEKE
jgi:DNA polymerase elongation subunit (family B)